MKERAEQAQAAYCHYVVHGDPKSLGLVYDQLAPELLRLALHLCQDAAQAEDVLQATFIAAIERAQTFDANRPLLPWMIGILAKEAAHARTRSQRTLDISRLPERATSQPLADAERSELLERLQLALERVPAAFRPVLHLKLRHGLSITEIAAALDRPAGTVRSQLARGSEILRRLLPAGLAGALTLLVVPTRGLAAVRAAVMTHAPQGTGVAGALLTVGGVLGMKKIALIAVACALTLPLVWLWQPPATAPILELAAPSTPVVEPLLPETQADRPASSETERSPLSATNPLNLKALLEEAEARATRLASLRLRVLWPDGSPAANEIVLLSAQSDWPGETSLVHTSDQDGRVQWSELEPVALQVRALRGESKTVQLQAGVRLEVELRIQAGVTALVEVCNADGHPIPEALVWLSEPSRPNFGHIIGRCDERGRLEVRCVSPLQYLGARMRHYAPSPLAIARGRNGEQVEVKLFLTEVGGTVRGGVFTEAGQPVAGATVRIGSEEVLYTERLADGSAAPRPASSRARTNPLGEFELEGIPLGTQALAVRAAGYGVWQGTAEVLPKNSPELRVIVQKEARLIGQVRSAEGVPVAGARIHSGPPFGMAAYSTYSDAHGNFELGGLGSQTIELLAEHPLHGVARKQFVPRGGERLEWIAELQSGPRILGRVVDHRGAGQIGFLVSARATPEIPSQQRFTRTDENGAFVFVGLEDVAYRLQITPADGFSFAWIDEQEVWPSPRELEFQLPSPEQDLASLRAEVVDALGDPIGGAELNVWHTSLNEVRFFPARAEDGIIHIIGLPPGLLELELRHASYPWKTLGRLTAEAGAEIDLGRIVLEQAGRLQVELRGVPVEEIPGICAVLIAPNLREGGVLELRGTSFWSNALAAGVYSLELQGDGVVEVQKSVTIEPGCETRLEVTLERCPVQIVELRAPAAAAKPSWIACTLLDAQGKLVWSGNADTSQPAPRVKVSAPAGSYQLWVGAEGDLQAQAALEIPAQGGAPIVVELKPR